MTVQGIKGRMETNQTTGILKSARLIRRERETWGHFALTQALQKHTHTHTQNTCIKLLKHYNNNNNNNNNNNKKKKKKKKKNCPGDLRRLALTPTPVKNHRLTLMWKGQMSE